MGNTLRAVCVSDPLLHPLTELQSTSSVFPFWPQHWQDESLKSYVLFKPSFFFFFFSSSTAFLIVQFGDSHSVAYCVYTVPAPLPLRILI